MTTTDRRWRYTVDIKQYMNREDEPTLEGTKATARDIADALAAHLRGEDRDGLEGEIERLRELGDPTDDFYDDIDDLNDEINFTLEDVYDYADATRIWLGLA
jgi:hypothetical protein